MKSSLCLFLLFILLSAPLSGSGTTRKSIGLALEGGGAHGLAHIGVLQWMEEHRIPVDYVAGTSMGALVGGAYATGMRPQDIENILKRVDWPRMLSGKLPYKALSFRRKEDTREYPNSLEFGLKGGVHLPSGFNPGQEIGWILDRVALPYSSVQDFNQLPIPFNCVAVELVSGQQQVFNRGSLALALRSSMSIPGFFTPVRSEGKVYVDGGLLNNLPVDVARRMGAETVIAVHLDQAKLDSKASLSSFSVLSWSLNAVTSSNELLSLRQADIAVTVALRDISWSSYTNSDEIIRRGYAAAAASAAQLLPFALDEEEWAQYLQAHGQREHLATAPIDFLEIEGVDVKKQELIGRELKDLTGKPLDENSLERKLTALRGTKRFHTLDYKLVKKGQSTGLLIIAKSLEYTPPMLNLLLDVNGSDYNNPQFGIGGRITFLDSGKAGREARVDVAAGSNYRLFGEYYMPIVGQRFFIAPRAGIDSIAFPVYMQRERIADYRQRQLFAGIDVGYSINRSSEVRLGYEAAQFDLSREAGSLTLPDVDGRRGLTRFRYAYLGVDDPIVPHEGDVLDFNGRWFDANPASSSPFPSVELSHLHFQPLGKRNSAFITAAGGSTLGKNDEGLPVFSLGGPLRLSAYASNELLTNQYFLFRAGYIHGLKSESSLLGIQYYLFGVYEIGKAYDVAGQSRLPNDVAVGVIAKTFFGPLLMGGAYGDTGHRKIFFRVGRLF
jgi:NTE family protein